MGQDRRLLESVGKPARFATFGLLAFLKGPGNLVESEQTPQLVDFLPTVLGVPFSSCSLPELRWYVGPPSFMLQVNNPPKTPHTQANFR